MRRILRPGTRRLPRLKPIQPVILIGLIISILGILGGAGLALFSLWRLNESGTQLSRFDGRVAEVRLADALTSEYARLYVFTGDPTWKGRHDRQHEALDRLVADVKATAVSPDAQRAMARYMHSHNRREMAERNAKSALAAGRPDEAVRLILSGDYEMYRDLAARSLGEAAATVRRGLAGELIQALAAMLTALLLLLASAIGLSLVFARLHRVMGQQAEELRAAGAALSAHAETLEQKIQLRTADLERAKRAAESADRAKSEFLAAMSHEVRTPLNAVLGFSELLKVSETDPMRLSAIASVQKSGEQLLELMSDILDLSRLESGSIALESAPYSPRAIIQSAGRLFTPHAERKGLSLKLAIEGLDETLCLGDGPRLRQLLAIFLSNAVKFTQTGSITLTADTIREANGLRLRLSIADTGCGIDAAGQARLFQPFVQADGSATRQFGGTGLGLAIAKDLAGLMGGRIEVDSTPGVGTTFHIEFLAPFAPVHTAPISARPPAPVEGLPDRLRVLVAEDNKQNQMVVRLLLERAGAAVTFADDGAEAVALWRAQPFDIILMDIQMPVMSGLEAAIAIRASEAAEGRPFTPILAVSANALPEDEQRSLAAGMNAHIAKPVRPGVLLPAMTAALSIQPADRMRASA
jgi:signal transduction histidine kinase